MTRIALALAALVLPACSGGITVELDREVSTLDAETAQRLVVQQGEGALSIVGDADATEVELVVILEGRPSDQTLDEVGAVRVLEQEGDAIRVRTDLPERNIGVWIETQLIVPAGMDLELTDRDGSAVIEDLNGNILVDDGDGSLILSRLGGDVEVDDGDGSITINEVAGSVLIADEDGSITVDGVGGSVVVDDGDGSITIDSVGADVLIDDGDGSIEVNDVEGEVVIRDGSGSITVRRSGEVDIVEDTSGSVVISDQ